MNQIYLFFTLGDALISKLIAKATKDEGQDWKEVPSHVAIVFFDYLVIESKAFGGFTISTLDQFLENKKLLHVYEVPQSSLELTHSKLEHLIRTKRKVVYDWLGALWLGVSKQIERKFGFKIPFNLFNSEKRDFCVEMCEDILGKELSNMSPLELMRELSK